MILIQIIRNLLITIFFFNTSSILANDTNGKDKYNSHCAICHMKSAPKLFNTKIKKDVFIKIVLNGRQGTMMGSFQKKLNLSDIEKIYFYLTSNAKNKT